MPLDYAKLMALPLREVRQAHTKRDTILYALSLGADELRYVYEEGLEALPTMAVALAYPGFWLKDPRYGVDWRKVLHGEQFLEVHRPLPVEGETRGVVSIDEIFDKGAAKGAILYSRREIYDAASGDHLATVRQSSFLRGDGGFGGRSDGAPAPHDIPSREPDHSILLATRADQALLYRLNGDYNPLHIDPAVAASAGFERPILHGLCTYGVVGRALLQASGRPASTLRQLDGRFSSPVYPGESIRTDIWRLGRDTLAFRALALERNVVAMNNGFARFV